MSQPVDVTGLTAHYEHRLGRQIPLIRADLDLKHANMASSVLRFLRGTYYLWLLPVPGGRRPQCGMIGYGRCAAASRSRRSCFDLALFNGSPSVAVPQPATRNAQLAHSK